MSWSSPYEDWRSRTTPYQGSEYVPLRSNIALAVLRNSPVEHEGFTLAIFNDKVAIDARGHPSVLADSDYTGILSIAQSVSALPDTGNFRNTWILQSETTSQPIDRIFVTAGNTLKEVSVQGFKKGKKVLNSPDGEIPKELDELAGLVLEARIDHQRGQEGPLVQKVKDILSDIL